MCLSVQVSAWRLPKFGCVLVLFWWFLCGFVSRVSGSGCFVALWLVWSSVQTCGLFGVGLFLLVFLGVYGVSVGVLWGLGAQFVGGNTSFGGFWGGFVGFSIYLAFGCAEGRGARGGSASVF